MQNQTSSIIRKSTRKNGERLNVLTCPTHEGYETALALTNCNFYALPGQNIKPWTTAYRPIPDNYYILPSQEIPRHLELDLVLSQQKFGQYQLLQPLAKQMGLGLVSLEHTIVMTSWNQDVRQKMRDMSGDIDIFISHNSANEWGWNNGEYEVILHGIDTNLFKPGIKIKPHILSVVNDFINRGDILGFNLWGNTVKDLPFNIVGDTKGLSKPAKNIEELIYFYQSARLFLNSSLRSPIPMSMLEAMSCGLPVVSTNNCMIPEVIEHGVNGFMSNNPKELRGYCELLLNDEKLAIEMGLAARKTIVDKFNLNRFVNEWNNVFERAANLTFKGLFV